MDSLLRRAVHAVPAVLALMVCGCAQPSARNHTPPQFPAMAGDLPPQENALNPYTPSDWSALAHDPAHRFILEVVPQNATIRHVRVNVDGTWQSMSQRPGTSLYTYEALNECRPSYTYHFAVEYAASWYRRTLTVSHDGSPFSLTTSGFGELVWWPELGAPRTTDGGARIVKDTSNNEIRIFVQNLGPVPQRIEAIALDPAGDAAKFILIERPGMPYDMACGTKARIGVKWTPALGDDRDSVDLVLRTATQSDQAGGGWVTDAAPVVIRINGMPHPS